MKVSKYNIIRKYEDKILVYNSFSKSSILLEKDSDTSCFENIDSFNKLSEEEKSILINNGFVISDDRDELSEIKYTFEQKFFENDTLTIALVPTLACNFACPYCFEKNLSCGKDNIKKYFECLKKYAEKNFKKHKLIQLSLFGGEPLIYIKECLEFLEWVSKDSEENKYNYITTITTNGSLLTLEILESLVKYNLKALQITIDSDKENHDKNRIFKNGNPSFDILMEKCNMVASYMKSADDFNFIIRINLNTTNVEKVSEALEHIDTFNRNKVKLLIRAIYNTHLYHEDNQNNVGDLKEYFDLGTRMGFNVLKEKYNFQTCEACADRRFFYLMPNLTLWKCINDLNYDKCCIGKINDEGVLELNTDHIVMWYNNCMAAFGNKKCLKCKMLPDCFGGCPLYRYKNGKNSCRTFDMSCLPFLY